jgi:two-component system response regulator RegX3
MWRSEVQVDRISGKVLTVSGDAEAGQFWADALRWYGVDVTVAWSAPEVLDALDRDGFDLILLDAYAHWDGVDLCRQIRGRTASPILLLAPGTDEACLLDGYRAGADDCVLKPISPAVLLAKVNAWLRRRCQPEPGSSSG